MSGVYQLSKLLEEDDILSVLDTLHLDEYVIDQGIDKIISKSHISIRQLNTLLVYIKYKLMLCLQEDEDCENGVIIDYVLQQLLQIPENTDENFDLLLKIFSHSLMLNKKSLTNNVEHITQQLISELNTYKKPVADENVAKCIVYLTIFDDLIATCLQNGYILNSRFLRFEFGNLIQSRDKRIDNHSWFSAELIVVISRKCYLHKRWKFTKDSHDYVEFYFWKIIQNGIASDDSLLRKYCVYLGKRAVDFALESDMNISVKLSNDDHEYFKYKTEEKIDFENSWKSFFIIMETLEEKQSHLVNSALNLLPKLEMLHPSWYNCALKRALMHETDSIVKKSLELAITKKSNAQYLMSFPYKQLLRALNKIFIYEDFFKFDKNNTFSLLKQFLSQKETLMNIIRCLAAESTSSVPRCCLSFVLSSIDNIDSIQNENIQTYIQEFLINYPANNPLLETATQHCMLNFYINQTNSFPKTEDFQRVISIFPEQSLQRNMDVWNKLTILMKKLYYKDHTIEMGVNLLNASDKESTLNAKSLSKLILILLDASVLNVDETIGFFKTKLSLLKECDKRSYASNDQFDSAYFLVSNFFVMLQTNNSSYDKRFIECITSQCDSVANYLSRRLQTTTQIDDFDLVNQCIETFNNLLQCENINILLYTSMKYVIDKAIVILKLPTIDLVQKYFAAKVLCTTASFIESREYFSINDKKNVINDFFGAINSAMSSIIANDREVNGRIVSAFNQTCCEIYYSYYKLMDTWTRDTVIDVNKNVHDFLEKGGSGCIISIVKFSSIVLEKMIKEEMWHEVNILLDQMWKEILEVRKNEQFKRSLREFVALLFNESVFQSTNMHPVLINFGNRLFDFGEVSPYAVCIMMKAISSKLANNDLEVLLPLIVRALLFGNVPRKDQRIESDVCHFFESQLSFMNSCDYILNPTEEVKVCGLEILIRQDTAFHAAITEELKHNACLVLKLKHRYHGNSMNHRILLRVLQALLLSWKSTSNLTTLQICNWCIKILTNQPHHISVRMLAEWYISLHLVHSEKSLKDNVDEFELLNLPQLSYFMIIYHVVKHQIILVQKKLSYRLNSNEKSSSINSSLAWTNFAFAMDTYMPFTMGQLFNIRLNAQYLTYKLYQLVETVENKDKYAILNNSIVSNFKMSSNEKSLKKIQEEFYVNHLDIIFHLSVDNIYNRIPRFVGVTPDELISSTYSKYLDDIKANVSFDCADVIVFPPFIDSSYSAENNDKTSIALDKDDGETMNIQKKFIPWKNMLNDLGILQENNNENSQNGLIIVASLIDKLPNLGGLSRTCEVFGVKQLVMSSTKYIQDKQFQSLSVSSEHWVNISEVQPGSDLKDYLLEMKRKGYKIIGAEQSSSSVKLTQFAFPKDMILLLGHEKEGISPDLLGILDDCVEIPQQGMVRSLNVHVTASIFIWEYSRQHDFLNKNL
ncbi:tRNA (guanosine(18)-2'-O)-methyltransferase TARBP1 [Arctopsyche grandis]|uniref:tRNA (guanosine(18)-2'-O)-methyltransferase TARBP1 n=1 Tax=Arctopsyche grandis TaxID=121162 RepID=UPI00406D8422